MITLITQNLFILFSADEDGIAEWTCAFQNASFPLTVSKLRSLAYQYAKLNNIKGFSLKNEMASCTWAKCFLRRYPHIKVCQATNLSVARAMAVNEPNIHNWFKEYQQVINTCGIVSPEQIWSGDETGIQNVPKEEKFLG